MNTITIAILRLKTEESEGKLYRNREYDDKEFEVVRSSCVSIDINSLVNL